jgi:HEPN domain-containing protein
MKRLTAEWVQKAETDFHAATALIKQDLPLHEAVCFHCQQCAEKYLKALLQEASAQVPRTHNLVELLTLITPHYRLHGFRRGLDFLNRFAVDTRYPGKSASKRQAAAAVRWAGKVRDTCRPLVGIT